MALPPPVISLWRGLELFVWLHPKSVPHAPHCLSQLFKQRNIGWLRDRSSQPSPPWASTPSTNLPEGCFVHSIAESQWLQRSEGNRQDVTKPVHSWGNVSWEKRFICCTQLWNTTEQGVFSLWTQSVSISLPSTPICKSGLVWQGVGISGMYRVTNSS